MEYLNFAVDVSDDLLGYLDGIDELNFSFDDGINNNTDKRYNLAINAKHNSYNQAESSLSDDTSTSLDTVSSQNEYSPDTGISFFTDEDSKTYEKKRVYSIKSDRSHANQKPGYHLLYRTNHSFCFGINHYMNLGDVNNLANLLMAHTHENVFVRVSGINPVHGKGHAFIVNYFAKIIDSHPDGVLFLKKSWSTIESGIRVTHAVMIFSGTSLKVNGENQEHENSVSTKKINLKILAKSYIDKNNRVVVFDQSFKQLKLLMK